MNLSLETVRNFFSYDETTGILYCKSPFGSKSPGDTLGVKTDTGY